MSGSPSQVLALLVLAAVWTAAACAPAASPPAERAPANAPASAPAAPAAAVAPAAVAPESTRPSQTTVVKAAFFGSSSDAGVYIADEKGFFRELGIEIQYEKVGSSGEMIPLLSTGQFDIGGPGISAGLLNALARGVDIKLVADKGSVSSKANSYMSFVARKELAAS